MTSFMTTNHPRLAASLGRALPSARPRLAAKQSASRLRLQRRQELLDLQVRRDLAALLGLTELALEALHRPAARQAGDHAHLVDEQHPVQVVDLVLPGPCLQVAHLLLDRPAL